jgi:RNA-directed DNA polymerase
VTEAYGDKKSFCCRRGRSKYDAIAYVLEGLKGTNAPEYVVVADVKTYYASLSHDWLMKHLPVNKEVLHEILRANIVEAGELFDRDGKGISEGCNLSPYIGNFALDGLQSCIYQGLYGENEGSAVDFANGNMIRYADDILVTVRTKEDGMRVLRQIDKFIKERGLVLKEEKTAIISVRDGFDYLKYHVVKKDDVVISYPSAKAVERIEAELYDVVCANMRNQRKLIEACNRKLRAWGNSYKFCEAGYVFEEVDGYLHNILFGAMQELYPSYKPETIWKRYWYVDFLGHRYFALPKERETRVLHLADIVRVKYMPVRVNVNPYVDIEYLEERSGVTAINNITNRYRPIWERQEGKCYYCGHELLPDQPIRLIEVNPRLRDTMANKAYIHQICEHNEFVYLHTLDDLDGMSAHEIDQMLVYASAEKQVKHRLKGDWKYRKLEKVSGYPISEAMRRDKNRWRARSTVNTMPDAWEEEGFRIAELNLEKEIVVFERLVTGRAKLKIPKVLLENEIPYRVKEEIEHFLNTIVRLRGLVKKKDYF